MITRIEPYPILPTKLRVDESIQSEGCASNEDAESDINDEQSFIPLIPEIDQAEVDKVKNGTPIMSAI